MKKKTEEFRATGLVHTGFTTFLYSSLCYYLLWVKEARSRYFGVILTIDKIAVKLKET